MLKELFKGAILTKALGFAARHKILGFAGLLGYLGYRNRHRLLGKQQSHA